MRTWIKLYTEIAHDRKMNQLSDRQFRACINLFALAGIVDDGGILPPVADMAYQLRIAEDELLEDMHILAQANILREFSGVWMVGHWRDRQAKPPSDSPEAILLRVHKHRAKQRNEDVTPLQNVTNVTKNVTPVTTREREEEKEEIEAPTAESALPPTLPPEVTRAITAAYDNAGITLALSKTHMDAHAETIARLGLDAWRKGWKTAEAEGKHNFPAYVARCAESVKLAPAANDPQFEALAQAMAEVCHMDFNANKRTLINEARLLAVASPLPTPELLRQYYNGGGWWVTNDWRGQRGQFPQPTSIRTTWGHWHDAPLQSAPVATEVYR